MQLNSGLSTRALINTNIEMKRRDDDNTTKAEWNCSLGLFCYIDVVARQFASGQASFKPQIQIGKKKRNSPTAADSTLTPRTPRELLAQSHALYDFRRAQFE